MLELIIITYNRSSYLRSTLNSLLNSKASKYKITVLDNSSTDDTLLVCNLFKDFTNLNIVSHKNNIGLGANIIRAIEISSSIYTWVLCDDDFIDISGFEDVEAVLSEGEVDLIHVGGHPQKEWKFGGSLINAKDLYKKGYSYFKFSSFLPSNIFKTEKFQKDFLVSGYANVINAYPHMPYLFDIYEKNSLIYIAKNQIVTAKVSGQSYSISTWFNWWMRTCELLTNKEDVRNAYLDQWTDNGESNVEAALKDFSKVKNESLNKDYYNYFEKKYFLDSDIKIIFKHDNYLRTRSERIKFILVNKIKLIKEIFNLKI